MEDVPVEVVEFVGPKDVLNFSRPVDGGRAVIETDSGRSLISNPVGSQKQGNGVHPQCNTISPFSTDVLRDQMSREAIDCIGCKVGEESFENLRV